MPIDPSKNNGIDNSEWNASTAIAVTDKGNLFMQRSSPELREVFHLAEQNTKIYLVFQDSFVDKTLSNKLSFLWDQLCDAATELKYKAIVKRIKQDNQYTRILMNAVCQ